MSTKFKVGDMVTVLVDEESGTIPIGATGKILEIGMMGNSPDYYINFDGDPEIGPNVETWRFLEDEIRKVEG